MARISLPSLAHLPAESEHSGIREIGNEALRTPGAIQLHVGQPNFQTPRHIGEAGKRELPPVGVGCEADALGHGQPRAAELGQGRRLGPDAISGGGVGVGQRDGDVREQ